MSKPSIFEDIITTFALVFVIVFLITTAIYFSGWWITGIELPFLSLLKFDVCAAGIFAIICFIDRGILGN